MSEAPRAVKTNHGWIRADMIVSVYAEYEFHENPVTHYAVKIRTHPSVTTWHPVVSRFISPEGAEVARDELARMLWGSS